MIQNGMKVGGLYTRWRLAEWTDRDKLLAQLDQVGLKDFCPALRRPGACLRSALEATFPGRHFLVQPLKKKDTFEVVRREHTDTDDHNDYPQELMAGIISHEEDGPTIGIRPLDGRQHTIIEAFERHSTLLHNTQITQFLVAMVHKLTGTRIGPDGGLYWLPNFKEREWVNVADITKLAAHSGSHSIYLLRHNMDADAVEAIRDAITDEIAGEATRMLNEIAKSNDPDTPPEQQLGQRALETRKNQCVDLVKKIELYEGLLGTALGSLKESVEKANCAACAASLLEAGAA